MVEWGEREGDEGGEGGYGEAAGVECHRHTSNPCTHFLLLLQNLLLARVPHGDRSLVYPGLRGDRERAGGSGDRTPCSWETSREGRVFTQVWEGRAQAFSSRIEVLVHQLTRVGDTGG